MLSCKSELNLVCFCFIVFFYYHSFFSCCVIFFSSLLFLSLSHYSLSILSLSFILFHTLDTLTEYWVWKCSSMENSFTLPHQTTTKQIKKQNKSKRKLTHKTKIYDWFQTNFNGKYFGKTYEHTYTNVCVWQENENRLQFAKVVFIAFVFSLSLKFLCQAIKMRKTFFLNLDSIWYWHDIVSCFLFPSYFSFVSFLANLISTCLWACACMQFFLVCRCFSTFSESAN